MRRRGKGRPVRETRGKLALAEWLAAEAGRSETSLAATLGVTQPLIAMWLRGVARPASDLRVALERLCSIPQEDWLDTEERLRVAKIHKAAS